MNGEGPRKGGPSPGLAATTTVAHHALELEALARLAGARDLIHHVVGGDVLPQPWTTAARHLVEQAERFLEVAA